MSQEHANHPEGRAPMPGWPPGTVAVLATLGDGPSAIPVSTVVPDGDGAVLLALGRRRDALARLRAEPRVALCLMAAGDVAVTLHGTATVVADPLPGADGVAAVRIATARVQDHTTARFVVDAGVRWHYVDDAASARNDAVLAGLRALAGGG